MDIRSKTLRNLVRRQDAPYI